MDKKDLLLLVETDKKLSQIEEITSSYMFSSREEFACNDSYIKMGVGILMDLVNITNKISATIILSSPYLTKEIPILNRYKECIFNEDNTINSYKLFDFLTLEIRGLKKEIETLLIK
jgi:hypothetical protein